MNTHLSRAISSAAFLCVAFGAAGQPLAPQPLQPNGVPLLPVVNTNRLPPLMQSLSLRTWDFLDSFLKSPLPTGDLGDSIGAPFLTLETSIYPRAAASHPGAPSAPQSRALQVTAWDAPPVRPSRGLEFSRAPMLSGDDSASQNGPNASALPGLDYVRELSARAPSSSSDDASTQLRLAAGGSPRQVGGGGAQPNVLTPEPGTLVLCAIAASAWLLFARRPSGVKS